MNNGIATVQEDIMNNSIATVQGEGGGYYE